MKNKKTKIGVEVSQTIGMKVPAKGTTWIVVGHQSRARIFEYDESSEALRLVNDIRHPQARVKGSRFVSDRPGRTFNSWTRAKGGHGTATPRHSYGSEDSPHLHELKVMSQKIVGTLENARSDRKFNRLVFVMPSKMMGILRKKIRAPMRRLITNHLDRDYAWVSRPALEKRLVEQLELKPILHPRQVPPPLGAFRFTPKD